MKNLIILSLIFFITGCNNQLPKETKIVYDCSKLSSTERNKMNTLFIQTINLHQTALNELADTANKDSSGVIELNKAINLEVQKQFCTPYIITKDAYGQTITTKIN